MNEAPLGNDEVDALLASLGRYGAVVLAVSGGGDSTALLHCAAAWQRRKGALQRLIVATVDHGLRPQSAGEAAVVAAQSAALGIVHRTLQWRGAKPTSGLQATARQARYDLLLRLAIEEALPGLESVIVTAHTADDQAETLLMRLLRGSGVDGLAAIPATGRLLYRVDGGGAVPVAILRPLLSVSRARLVATLTTAGIPFLHDPSNDDRRFERVRVRQALEDLAELGLTAEALARSARRLQRAQAALVDAADRLWTQAVRVPYGIVVELDWAPVAAAPDEIGLRVLRRALDLVGGAAPAAELSALEEAHLRLFRGSGLPPSFTLGGAILDCRRNETARDGTVRIYREPERGDGLPVVSLDPGKGTIWDDRFEAHVSSEFPNAVEIGPLGDDWLILARQYPCLAKAGLPVGALKGVPTWRLGGQILGVPLLADIAHDQGDAAAAEVLRGGVVTTGPDAAGQRRPLLAVAAIHSVPSDGEPHI